MSSILNSSSFAMMRVFAVLLFIEPSFAQQNPCASGETFKCPDGSTPSGSPPCTGGKPQCCSGNTCKDAPAGGQPGGGAGPGGGGGAQACVNPTCTSPPCAAGLVGDVGCTTAVGTEKYDHEMKKKGDSIPANTHIFGPFEAGFSQQQNSIIESWGCSDPTVVHDAEGGLDLNIAEEKVARACNIQLPRFEGTTYKGIVGWCGGHTSDYHFHRGFGCVYTFSGTHSPQLGVVASHKLYGKWEDYSKGLLPHLDACGAHFGPVPGGTGNVYHYHVQDKPPFTVGCLGPDTGNKLMSVARCRTLYASGNRKCDASGYSQINIKRNGASQTVTYDKWCPCFDADGSNLATNIKELPALSTADISYKAPSTTSTAVPSAVASTSKGVTSGASSTTTLKFSFVSGSPLVSIFSLLLVSASLL